VTSILYGSVATLLLFFLDVFRKVATLEVSTVSSSSAMKDENRNNAGRAVFVSGDASSTIS